MKQTLFLNDVLYSFERTPSFEGYTPEGWHAATSQALVCPRCLRIWAWLRLEESPNLWPIAEFCEGCGEHDEWHPVPGSILRDEGYRCIDRVLLAALPEAILRREFDLHIKAAEWLIPRVLEGLG